MKTNRLRKRSIIFTFLFCLIAAFALIHFTGIRSEAADTPIVAGVKAFQTYINNNLPSQYLGTPLAVDGYAGELTKRAASKLIQYRLNTDYNAGLVVDGHFGPASQAAFNQYKVMIKRYETGMGIYTARLALLP